MGGTYPIVTGLTASEKNFNPYNRRTQNFPDPNHIHEYDYRRFFHD